MAKRFELGVVLAFLLSVSAWADVPIDERHFLDEMFMLYVMYMINGGSTIYKLQVVRTGKER